MGGWVGEAGFVVNAMWARLGPCCRQPAGRPGGLRGAVRPALLVHEAPGAVRCAAARPRPAAGVAVPRRLPPRHGVALGGRQDSPCLWVAQPVSHVCVRVSLCMAVSRAHFCFSFNVIVLQEQR